MGVLVAQGTACLRLAIAGNILIAARVLVDRAAKDCRTAAEQLHERETQNRDWREP
jgi:hypothetical protein